MFAGLLSLDPSRPAEAVLDTDAWRATLRPFFVPDLEGSWTMGPALLVQTRVFNGPATRDGHVPLKCPKTGVGLAFWGRLDNRPALVHLLAGPEGMTSDATDGELVLAAWRRWGEDLPQHLVGDFALAVADPERSRIFLARDAIGVKPLYYAVLGDLVAFATSAAALRELPGKPLTPSDEWMARYLLHLSASREVTAFDEVLKVIPGHSVVIDRDGPATQRRWHEWRDDAPAASRRDGRWVDAYRQTLEEAIRCRMTSDSPLGTENSGGLDSATITAYLARFLPEPRDRLHAFGFAMGAEEPALILAVATSARIHHSHVFMGERTIDSSEEHVERDLRVLGLPLEHANASSHQPFYEECALHGIRTLFSGFGGDEAVTHHAIHLHSELVDQRRYLALWRLLRGTAWSRSVRFGKEMTVGRRRSLVDATVADALADRWPHVPLRAEVVERHGLFTSYMDAARAGSGHRRLNDHLLQQLLPNAYIPTRLENCTLLAGSYGVEYRWPLWDVRLIQQYLSTPTIEKRGPEDLGRYLHRRAVTGVVPPEVAWRRGKVIDFSRLMAELRTQGVTLAVARMREIESRLHPRLDALVDREQLRSRRHRAEAGSTDEVSADMFRQTVRQLTWLNEWLWSLER